jgi:hypothetical protein
MKQSIMLVKYPDPEDGEQELLEERPQQRRRIERRHGAYDDDFDIDIGMDDVNNYYDLRMMIDY